MEFCITMASSSSSSQFHQTEVTNFNLTRYLPLYKAIIKGEIERVDRIYQEDPLVLEARVTENMDTALHIAVATGTANHIVKFLVDRMSTHELVLLNSDGDTVLSIAAIVGNIKAAKMIMNKQPNLTRIANHDGWVPLLEAARHGQKEMISYLLRVDGDYLQAAGYSADKAGVFFIYLLIIAGFYDLALELVQKHPPFATGQCYGGDSLLSALAAKPSAFPSGRHFKFLERLMYKCVPMKLIAQDQPSDVVTGAQMQESTIVPPDILNTGCQKFPIVVWKILETLYPRMKDIRDTKSMHLQTLELVRYLCSEMAHLDHSRASSMLQKPLIVAAQSGIHEIVEGIVESFPHAMWISNDENHNAFQIAVMNRRENVFDLINRMDDLKNLLLVSQDNSGNNILHLAGKIAPQNRMSLISGAALQMQHELRWFKEVEKIVKPAYREDKNSRGKTPAMVFTDEHKLLVKQGEKWMKDTASSCTVVAALIATVVFAAAITVPGGTNNDDGHPLFSKQKAFIIFAISDALSLFSSIAAILMFLSILTARYSEADFLYALPKRLIWGLLTLFLSITSMMIAFSATVYLVFCNQEAWILAPLGLLACLPVSLFVSLQFPLLVDIIASTYKPRIFEEKRRGMLF